MRIKILYTVTQGEIQNEAQQDQKDQADSKKQKEKTKPQQPHPGRTELRPHLERNETIVSAYPDDCYC